MNQEHLKNLNRGKNFWNEWRKRNLDIEPDFKEARLTSMDSHLLSPLKRKDLRGYDLRGANFWKANLRSVDLSEANLSGANLNQANLEEADLTRANLKPETNFPVTWIEEANLSKAILRNADLSSVQLWGSNLSRATCSNASFCHANLGSTDLFKANFSGACLRESILQGSRLVETNFENADLEGSSVWGASVWDVNLSGAIQSNLIITPEESANLTVDDLEIAQFLYLLLNNDRLRNVIDNMVQKAVLILGRFTPERLAILREIQQQLRQRNYLPILFDFENSARRNLTETVSTIAHLARFIIADLTDPKAIHQELQRIVPNLPSVPVQPILQASVDSPLGMLEDFQDYDWYLDIFQYDNLEALLDTFDEDIIQPSETKVEELLENRIKRAKDSRWKKKTAND